MSEELTRYNARSAEPQSLAVPGTLAEIQGYAKLFAESGFFVDSKQLAQAAVKIIAGAECGIRPFAAINGIHIINGKPAMGADLLATLVKRSGRYNYRVVEMTNTNCEIEYFECGEPIGRSMFSLDDAKRAGTKNLDKFARNMLFARAMSNGVRWYCPDVTAGPTYTPEEMGAPVDSEGNYKPPPAPIQVRPEPKTVQPDTAFGMSTNPDEPPPEEKEYPDPLDKAFHKHMVDSMVAVWKESKITPTLKNVSDALSIEPGDAEGRYWARRGDKSHFVPSRCTDADLLRLGHYAKTGGFMDAEQQSAVDDTLAEIRRQWEEGQKEAAASE